MAIEYPSYEAATGKPVYSPDNGKPAKDCAGEPESCRDLTCPNSDSAVVTVAGAEADCTCVADTYNVSNGGSGWVWSGLAGFCETPFETDFTLQITCQAGGMWLIEIISVVGGLTYFTGTATTAEISCGGGAFTGAATIAGQDVSGSGGPDCSGCTATITF